MRAIPMTERPKSKAFRERIQSHFEPELERDGRFGAANEHTPRPDITVADLMELCEVFQPAVTAA